MTALLNAITSWEGLIAGKCGIHYITLLILSGGT